MRTGSGSAPAGGRGTVPSLRPLLPWNLWKLWRRPRQDEQGRPGFYSDRALAERRTAQKTCICPSFASNRGECPVHDELGRVR